MTSKPSKLEILTGMSFGSPVAEDEQEALARYFVETNTWNEIYKGQIDVVYGPKGSGKSAIYLLIQSYGDALFDKGILLVPAEEIRGAPAFSDLVTDPPASERKFTDMWKLYFLTLVGRAIKEWGISGDSAQEVLSVLAEAGLLPEPTTTLRRVLGGVRDYVRRYTQFKEIEPTMHIDPVSGAPTGFSGKIVFQEPTPEERKRGNVTPEELFEKSKCVAQESRHLDMASA